MDTALYSGDHKRDERGFLQMIDTAQEAVQRAVVRLTVPRGSFKPDKELGSRLHTLARGMDSKKIQELALEYAQEALLDEEEIRVISAKRVQEENDGLWLEFELEYSGEGGFKRARIVWELNY